MVPRSNVGSRDLVPRPVARECARSTPVYVSADPSQGHHSECCVTGDDPIVLFSDVRMDFSSSQQFRVTVPADATIDTSRKEDGQAFEGLAFDSSSSAAFVVLVPDQPTTTDIGVFARLPIDEGEQLDPRGVRLMPGCQRSVGSAQRWPVELQARTGSRYSRRSPSTWTSGSTAWRRSHAHHI